MRANSAWGELTGNAIEGTLHVTASTLTREARELQDRVRNHVTKYSLIKLSNRRLFQILNSKGLQRL